MKTSIKFEGGAELAATLQRLSEAASKKVTREALVQGGEPIRAASARHAPRRPPQPDLADHIVISTQKAQGDETAAIAIGPEKGFAYGLPVEIGTADTPAQPYMRPGFDGNVSKALATISAAFWTVLTRFGVSRSVSMPTTPRAPGGGVGL